mgnify:CR=1 FL=1
MTDLNDRDQFESENKDDAGLYLDCVRFVEGGHIRRFENFARKFDIVQYELDDGPSKSLLFYAIEHNDEMFMKILLDMEIPLEKKYTVSYFHFLY